MEVEGVIADAPSLVAFLLRVGNLVSLTVHAGLHDVISADSTVINMDVPCPKRHSIPFLYLESLC